jgi:hypothetical protein
MYKLHYPRLIVSMRKEPPILKMFFVLRGMIPRGTTLEFEYLGEFEMEIKNILGHESGAHMGLIHEKTRGQKSRATLPLTRSFSFATNSHRESCFIGKAFLVMTTSRNGCFIGK